MVVAPAEPEGHDRIHRFAPVRELPLHVPATLVASRNDPWMRFDRARHLAKYWRADLIDLGFAGHINVASGFGPWPGGKQLRDDLLDAFGDPALTGKGQGGDLRNGKKTWLLIRGLELEALSGGRLLRDQLAMEAAHRDVQGMVSTLRSTGVEREAEAEVLRLELVAERCLYAIDPVGSRIKDLRALMDVLRARKA